VEAAFDLRKPRKIDFSKKRTHELLDRKSVGEKFWSRKTDLTLVLEFSKKSEKLSVLLKLILAIKILIAGNQKIEESFKELHVIFDIRKCITHDVKALLKGAADIALRRKSPGAAKKGAIGTKRAIRHARSSSAKRLRPESHRAPGGLRPRRPHPLPAGAERSCRVHRQVTHIRMTDNFDTYGLETFDG